jgi:hypothetical protein
MAGLCLLDLLLQLLYLGSALLHIFKSSAVCGLIGTQSVLHLLHLCLQRFSTC